MEINRSKMVPGVLLLLFGVYLLLYQTGLVPGESFLMFLGIAFISVYYMTQKVGFLIPGGILLGFGTGVTLLRIAAFDIPEYVLIFGGLALGFYLITILSLKKSGFWPVIPGTVMLAFAFLIYGMETGFIRNYISVYFELAFPIIIIAAGVLVIVTAFKGSKKQ